MTPNARVVCAAMVVLAWVGSSAGASDGSFVKTCVWDACKFRNNRILGTYCNNDKTEIFDYDWTQIDLSKCVGNNGGTLVASENGRFHSSCEKCKLTNSYKDGTQYLACRCHRADEKGGTRKTKIDLDKVLYNHNGTLGCHGHEGSKFRRPPPEWDPDTDAGDEA
ncbi:hypothetical protein VdG1_02869 [Verticillium dahliae VDG1]|nr:hypothetical protein VdG1_02869 [Verticillium dahliae VDG1]